MVVLFPEVVGALQHRLLAVADLRHLQLDAPGLGLGAPVAELAQPRRHVGDHRTPAGEVDLGRLGAKQARAHRRHAAQVLRHGEARGVVGRDAARGQLLDDLVALLRARDLDHDVLALARDLQALLQHPPPVAHPAGVDLAGDQAVLAARRLVDGQDGLRALGHQLQIEGPVDALDIERRIGRRDLLDPPRPDVGRQLDRLQAERRIGGDPPEAHGPLGLDGVRIHQPRQLLLPARGAGAGILGQGLVLPARIDQRGRVPPDLGFGIGRRQALQGVQAGAGR